MTASNIKDLRRAEWPADPYGYDHGSRCSEVALHVAMSYGLVGDALKIVEHAAMYHDLGRRAPWRGYDPDHGKRSAELARHVIHQSGDWRALPHHVDHMCRVIANHSVMGPAPTDPMAIALWDADLLDSVRLVRLTDHWDSIKDLTGEPLFEAVRSVEPVRSRFAKLVSPWARQIGVQRLWVRDRAKEIRRVAATPGWDPLDPRNLLGGSGR